MIVAVVFVWIFGFARRRSRRLTAGFECERGAYLGLVAWHGCVYDVDDRLLGFATYKIL